MAKMHSRARGVSGSKKPHKLHAPSWMKYSEKEIEMIITKLGKEGQSPSQIGLHLRDVYGVPDVRLVTKSRITKLLESKGIKPRIPEDLMALLKRVIDLKKHLEENRKDMTAKRGLQLTESKIKRLADYYKSKGRLPADWKYTADNVRLLIE